MQSSLRLTSRTLIGKDESKKIKNILQSLLSTNDSIQFRVPVDWKSLNLNDYPLIVKNPMDLGTVVSKLNEDKYIYVEEALDDIQLIWDNCKMYNPASSWIYNLAEKLERSFKKMVKNYLSHISIVVPGRNAPLTKDDKKISQVSQTENDQKEQIQYNEKVKLSQKFKSLSPSDLGIVVQLIIQKCPTAFKETGEQSAQLLVDNLDSSTFKQISMRIDNILYECQDKVTKRPKLQ